MATPATASQYTSTTRLQRVKELWIADKANREEIGRLLYEERSERLSVGGAGNRTGFHQWLRDAGIPKQSAYRRIAEYEISIGVRAPEDDYDKPVPNGTSLPAPLLREPVEQLKAQLKAPEPATVELREGMLVKHRGKMYEVINIDEHAGFLSVVASISNRDRRKLRFRNVVDGGVILLRTKILQAEELIRQWEEQLKTTESVPVQGDPEAAGFVIRNKSKNYLQWAGRWGKSYMGTKNNATIFKTMMEAFHAKSILCSSCDTKRAYWPDAITIVDLSDPSQVRSDELHQLYRKAENAEAQRSTTCRVIDGCVVGAKA